MGMPIAVVDCETTGLFSNDRVVEVAVVTVDSETLEVVDEFDTLINPERDTGPAGIHGVTASMVEAAPVFSEVATALSRRLHGAYLASHNLPLDCRMLSSEFSRLDVEFDKGVGFCTLSATRKKLSVACEQHGIALTQQHRALGDARATAQLVQKLFDPGRELHPAAIGNTGTDNTPLTLRREAHMDDGAVQMARVVSHTHYPSADEAVIQYLDMLDWVLDDLVMTEVERTQLEALSAELCISTEQRQSAHEQYLRAIITGAQRNAVMTNEKHQLISKIAELLEVSSIEIPEETELQTATSIAPGTRICFTGTVVINDVPITRDVLERLATAAGLKPTSSVTKMGCDLLIASDTSSMSGKTKQARKFGIPVLATEDFLLLLQQEPQETLLQEQ